MEGKEIAQYALGKKEKETTNHWLIHLLKTTAHKLKE